MLVDTVAELKGTIRERQSALERLETDQVAARERIGELEWALAARRRGDGPKILRLLEILGEAERRREQEDDRSSSRGDDAGDD